MESWPERQRRRSPATRCPGPVPGSAGAGSQGPGLPVADAAPDSTSQDRTSQDRTSQDSPAGQGAGAAGDTAWVFTRNEEWPLDADLVVVDEVSMLDAELAAALVEACADGTRLLLVGSGQLPSIGPGRVLADIIDSGAVPVTELPGFTDSATAGSRTARHGRRGGTLPAVDSPEREVVVVPVRGSADAARRWCSLSPTRSPGPWASRRRTSR